MLLFDTNWRTNCRELKERLKPELLQLIRQQRLNRLCQGTMFRKLSSRRRQGQQTACADPRGKRIQTHCCWFSFLSSDKRWYCRLSPNHKMLHFGDVEDDVDNPPIETLQEKSELNNTTTTTATTT